MKQQSYSTMHYTNLYIIITAKHATRLGRLASSRQYGNVPPRSSPIERKHARTGAHSCSKTESNTTHSQVLPQAELNLHNKQLITTSWWCHSDCLSEGIQYRLLSETNTQLSTQRAHQVPRLTLTTCDEQPLDLICLLGHYLYTSTHHTHHT